jgi:hypothetical protein
LLTYVTDIHILSPHVLYLLVVALYILSLLMIVAHDKVLYAIALPVLRLHFVVLCFTPTCYILGAVTGIG